MSDDIKLLSIYDFGKICRTCLEEGEMKPLYETCSDEICLIEKLMSCTFVKFSENDGLPVQICANCVEEINQAFTFAKKCQKADTALRKCVSDVQNKLRKKSKNNVLRQTRTRNHSNTESQENVSEQSNGQMHAEDLKTVENIEIKNEIHTEDNKTIDQNNFETIEVKHEPSKLDYDDFSDPNDNYDDSDDELYIPDKPEKITTSSKVQSKRRRSSNSIDIKSETSDEESNIPLKKRANNHYKLKTTYECKKCSETFPNYQSLKLHREEKQHPPNKYNRKVCNICNKSVGYSRMKQHMRTHTLEKPYCCELCGARFSVGSNLRRHKVARHSAVKPYKCDTCGKGFTRLGLMKDHQRIHTGEKPFVCNFCGKSFARNTAFKTHLFVHAKSGETTGQVATEHQCPECQRCFATKTLLKAHQLIHGEKKFLCSDCGRGFVSMILLKSHSKVHTGIRPYKCEFCNKQFSHIGSLKSHNLIHTGQKPFICSVCNRAFTQRNHLKYHMRTHSGERPYECSVCGKTFALNGNLTVHMRTHTGETPFVCPICGKGFHDSSSMKKHKKGHPGQNESEPPPPPPANVLTVIGI